MNTTKTKPREKRRRAPTVYPTGGAATVADASVFLSCGKSTVYDLVRKGILRKAAVGNDIRIPWSALWEYIGEPVKPPADLAAG